MIGTILKIATKVVGMLIPDKPKEIIEELVTSVTKSDKEIEMELRELELLIENAKNQRELIKTEVMSEDPYVRRARPTFLWLMYLILIINFVVLPIAGRPMVDLPTALYWLFGSAFLGYGTLRTIDKSRNGLSGLINGTGAFLGIKKK